MLWADSAGEDQLHVRPPTVWISFLRHEAFEERDLASLEKVQYGASIEVAVIGLSDEKWIEAVRALVRLTK